MAQLTWEAQPITFDTTGFEHLDGTRWFDPETRDVVVLGVGEALPRSTHWLYEIDVLRRELAHTHAARPVPGPAPGLDPHPTARLLEADAVALDGCLALYTLVAEKLPKSATGRLFRASFVLAKADRTAVLTGQFEEWEISGMRESLVNLQTGGPDGKRGGHPYDPELPFEPSDDPAWDEQFPRHPLSKARAWVRTVRESAVVAREFKALPPFRTR
ncbi:hypothetical protein GCM10010329_30410 [Streptomyces spiroverticillatus]|uniref:Uncharacterized protein n=1 Tax=Streptomyces finlayi TaxID=67296 RepID=A0A918WWQ4_9ACTN|nr:hypothetical protein [Streptomyces finlayi]GHA05822.1 hypothetical protein GCM10010329_30410 [Streptomyces spiroverticillatus]GHC89579.1 hypothetical protein GCM10010334_22820 [Streptomyces finlayi]